MLSGRWVWCLPPPKQSQPHTERGGRENLQQREAVASKPQVKRMSLGRGGKDLEGV